MNQHYVIGEGKQVVTLGFYKSMPAVFIVPARNKDAVAGAVIVDGPDACHSGELESDEIVFTFPTTEWRDRFHRSLFAEDVMQNATPHQEEKDVNWNNDVMEPGITFATRPKLSEYSGEVLDVKK